MQIQVITGVSVFNNTINIVGVALKGEANTENLCKVAESFRCGRPAATEQIGAKRTEAEEIAYLVGRWTDWAVRNNIPLTINTTPKWVCAF